MGSFYFFQSYTHEIEVFTSKMMLFLFRAQHHLVGDSEILRATNSKQQVNCLYLTEITISRQAERRAGIDNGLYPMERAVLNSKLDFLHFWP